MRESEIGQLYGVSLRDFVRARNAFAARLGEAGRAAEADRVRRLPKPSVPVWLVNQLARRHSEDVERLLRAVDRLRAVQLGQRGGEGAAEAAAAEGRVLADLRRAAAAVGRDAGFQPSAAILERVAATLLAAAADGQTHPALREGRLETELARPGFEVFAGAIPRVPTPASRKAEPRGRRPPLRRAREAVEAATVEFRAATREAERLGKRADRHRRTAEAAARAAEQARTEARRATERLDAARQALRAEERDAGQETRVPPARPAVAE